MDNPDADSTGADNLSAWGPRPVSVALVGVAGILMAFGFTAFSGDVPGRILSGIAAVGLLVFAAGSWRARPRLMLTADALLSRGWFRTRALSRSEVTSIRITEFRRLGRRVRLLEIDAHTDTLLVFSRWDLGTDPLDVLDALTEAGWTGV